MQPKNRGEETEKKPMCACTHVFMYVYIYVSERDSGGCIYRIYTMTHEYIHTYVKAYSNAKR